MGLRLAILLIGSHFCRGTFDGWLCWADTEAGVTVHQPCPEFISGFDPMSEYFTFYVSLTGRSERGKKMI